MSDYLSYLESKELEAFFKEDLQLEFSHYEDYLSVFNVDSINGKIPGEPITVGFYSNYDHFKNYDEDDFAASLCISIGSDDIAASQTIDIRADTLKDIYKGNIRCSLEKLVADTISTSFPDLKNKAPQKVEQMAKDICGTGRKPDIPSKGYLRKAFKIDFTLRRERELMDRAITKLTGVFPQLADKAFALDAMEERNFRAAFDKNTPLIFKPTGMAHYMPEFQDGASIEVKFENMVLEGHRFYSLYFHADEKSKDLGQEPGIIHYTGLHVSENGIVLFSDNGRVIPLEAVSPSFSMERNMEYHNSVAWENKTVQANGKHSIAMAKTLDEQIRTSEKSKDKISRAPAEKEHEKKSGPER